MNAKMATPGRPLDGFIERRSCAREQSVVRLARGENINGERSRSRQKVMTVAQ